MRILGIDPGLQTTGFGIIERDGQQLRYVASGTICTTRTEGVALGNLPILIYLCKRETTIWPDLKSFISGRRL